MMAANSFSGREVTLTVAFQIAHRNPAAIYGGERVFHLFTPNDCVQFEGWRFVA